MGDYALGLFELFLFCCFVMRFLAARAELRARFQAHKGLVLSRRSKKGGGKLDGGSGGSVGVGGSGGGGGSAGDGKDARQPGALADALPPLEVGHSAKIRWGS